MNSPESINSEQQESSFFSTEDINAWRDEQKAKYNETDYPDEEMRELILLGIDQKAEAMMKERQAELGRYENQWAKLKDQDEYNKTGSDRMEEYETGLHSKTGRPRTVISSGTYTTYTPFDLYPRQKIVDENGEERFQYAEEQGATIRFANDIAKWTKIIPKSELRMDNLTSAEGNKLYYDFISGLMEKLPREKGEKLSDYENRVKEYVDSNRDSLLEYFKAKKSLVDSSRPSPSYKNEEEEKILEEKYNRVVEDGDGPQLLDEVSRIQDKIDKAKDDGVIKPWLAERLRERKAAKLALKNHLEPEVRQWRDEEMESSGKIANAKGMTSEQIEAINQVIAERAKQKQASYEREQASPTTSVYEIITDSTPSLESEPTSGSHSDKSEQEEAGEEDKASSTTPVDEKETDSISSLESEPTSSPNSDQSGQGEAGENDKAKKRKLGQRILSIFRSVRSQVKEKIGSFYDSFRTTEATPSEADSYEIIKNDEDREAEKDQLIDDIIGNVDALNGGAPQTPSPSKAEAPSDESSFTEVERIDELPYIKESKEELDNKAEEVLEWWDKLNQQTRDAVSNSRNYSVFHDWINEKTQSQPPKFLQPVE